MIYKESGNKLSEMVFWVIDIGRSNLYGGTGAYSKWSLRPTMEVLKIMEEYQLPLPDLAIFEKSSFAESNGWGIKREKSFFE